MASEVCVNCKKEGKISRDCEPSCPNFGVSPSTGKPLPHFVVKAKKEGHEHDQELKTGGPKTLVELVQWINGGKKDDITIYAIHNPKVMELLKQLKEISEEVSKLPCCTKTAETP